MPAFIDETGKVYGQLTVIEHLRKPSRLRCLCSCGTERMFTASLVRAGDATTCGACLRNTVVGKTYGRLTVTDCYNIGPRLWATCTCMCGATKDIRVEHLQGGRIVSCGCFQKECAAAMGKRQVKHGKYAVEGSVPAGLRKTFGIWVGMHNRCSSSAEGRKRKHYYDKGIRVCDRWSNFWFFVEDMGARPGPGYSVDRIDNDSNYCKENCRWATCSEQMRNTSKNNNLTFNGKTQCIAAWAEELNMNAYTLYARSKRGLPVERVLSTQHLWSVPRTEEV